MVSSTPLRNGYEVEVEVVVDVPGEMRYFKVPEVVFRRETPREVVPLETAPEICFLTAEEALSRGVSRRRCPGKFQAKTQLLKAIKTVFRREMLPKNVLEQKKPNSISHQRL